MNYSYASNALCADYDILIAIYKEEQLLRTHIPTLTSSKHVLGHQDNNKPYHSLSRPAQLNISADKLATEALQVLILNPPLATLQNPHCPIYLRNENGITSSHEKHLLQWKWSELRLQEYYVDKFDIPPDKFLTNLV